MDGENLPTYLIYKGANTPWSKIKKEFKDVEARATYGYPEGKFYMVQTKAWTNQDRMLDWDDWFWDPYNNGSHHGGRDTYLLMDKLFVHLMKYVCNIINKCGSEVEFIPGVYTGCLQILDKGINNPFK
jgi:hypothetical protein